MNEIKIIECPRDAMQGWKNMIPTEKKVKYIQSLLEVGFNTIDFGSFVSARAIPQMADTREVLQSLDLKNKRSGLLAIVANPRGAEEAVQYEQIDYLGFPFSISSTFQQRNTNSSPEESVERVHLIQELCLQTNKKLVVYLSMAFGNPYGDEYNESVLLKWAGTMADMGISILSLADTVGVATPSQISFALGKLIPAYSNIEMGVHLHSAPHNFYDKLEAAFQAGCTRFDGALKGIGGCPMAQDALVGNMNTENIIDFLEQKSRLNNIDHEALKKSLALATEIFV